MRSVIAVLLSDTHFSDKAPSFRSAESDWYAAQKRSIDELRHVADAHQAPIICVGDIVDRWSSPPRLINFLIDTLPKMYSVYGNHDCPDHRSDQLDRSAYGTLVRAGVLIDLGDTPTRLGSFWVHPFPWGKEITLLENPEPGYVHLAVVHRYIWSSAETSYTGADTEMRIGAYRDKLRGYTASVFGDNHIGWTSHWQDLSTGREHYLMNCGTFLRRKSDEINYHPQIGLLHSDGSITPHFLDILQDKFTTDPIREKKELSPQATKFLDDLRTLEQDSLDFRFAINRYFDANPTDDDVKKVILDSLDT